MSTIKNLTAILLFVLLVSCKTTQTYKTASNNSSIENYNPDPNAVVKAQDSLSYEPSPVMKMTIIIAQNPEINLLEEDSVFEGFSFMIDSTFIKNLDSKHKKASIRSVEKEVIGSTVGFYKMNDYQPKWLSNKEQIQMYLTFNEIISNSDKYGLDPNDYSLDVIDKNIHTLSNSDQLDSTLLMITEIDITKTYFLFTKHIVEGKIDNPGNGKKMWIVDNDEPLNLNYLLSSTNDSILSYNINALRPHFDRFHRLQQALMNYRNLDEKYGDTLFNINLSSSLKIGDTSTVIPSIRKRLAITDNELEASVKDSLGSLVFTPELGNAIARFQARHGLERDTVLGKNTVRHLNISFAEKVKNIELNMERHRWQLNYYYDNYIYVNIPEYKLKIYEKGEKTLEMKIIIGALHTPTPVFNDTLKYLVFSPTWTMPTSIIKKDIIPALKENPSRFSNRDYSFYYKGTKIDETTFDWTDDVNPYSLRVVQQSGPRNALGLVKFIFPNDMSIYMHDTPTDYLFNRNKRAFSHGCVRLEEPDKLAEYFLQFNKKEWSHDDVIKNMNLKNPKYVYLEKQYPIMINYYTAWVSEDGTMNFRDDIYGHDENQSNMLTQND